MPPFGDNKFILLFFIWHVEPLAAPGQKNDTVFYQIGCRQILPVPERDLWEIGLSMEKELYESGIFHSVFIMSFPEEKCKYLSKKPSSVYIFKI